MKKFIHILLALLLPVAALAQSNGVSSTKTRSEPDENGVYKLTLESFVTGVTTTVVTAEPVDIVLVLDVSGSMSQSIGSYYYAPLPEDEYTYNSYGNKSYYYKHTDGNYYQVSRSNERAGGWSWTTYYRLRYKVGNTYYYLLPNGTSTTTAPTNITSQYDPIYTGVLYERSNSRMAALKSAVNDFVDQIQYNANYTTEGEPRGAGKTLDNRIAIVKFANDAYYDSETGIAEGNHRNAPYNGSYVTDYNYTEVVKQFTSVTDAGVTSLKTAIANLEEGGGTAAHYGMQKAKNLLEQDIPSGRKSKRTVVLFTDGAPGMTGYDAAFANSAIEISKSIKNDLNATVFTIGLFTASDATDNVNNYMDYVSSNFPDATDMDHPGNRKASTYYQKTSGMNLASIFNDISSQAGSSGNTSVTSTTVMRDVITSSFALPDGTDPSQIKTFTYDCYGESNGELLFNNKQPFNATVSIVENTDGTKTVDVTGFDYSANWCGDRGGGNYSGKKLSIEIPVIIDPNSVGGAAVTTNTTASGLYIPDEQGNLPSSPISSYDVPPGVTSPVNIWIKKLGLEAGESAEFRIDRRHAGAANEEANYSYFTTVLVIGNTATTVEGAPMVKILNLDPGYIYRITETSWGWTYTNSENTNTTGGQVQYSNELRSNPFIFGNTKDNSKKNAEHVLVNDF